jgi:serine/threonine protein kinase
VRRIVEQIAKGLQALHRKEMQHQDLRPDNIMIDRHGTMKIIDFGSVHVAGLAEGTREAGAEELLGSLQYTAPEYFTGEGGSAQSDLFSLALITYQMLTGALPCGLQVTQVRGTADLHKLSDAPVRHTRPDLPAWLDSVLRQALHPQPAPLLERDPACFWRGVTLLLALLVLVLGLLVSRPGVAA